MSKIETTINDDWKLAVWMKCDRVFDLRHIKIPE